MADVAFRPALCKPLPPPRGYGHPSAPPAHLSEQSGDDTNSPTAANAAKASPGAASPPRTRDTHQQLAPKWTIAGFKLMVPCASSGTAETAGKAVINPTKATAAQSAAATSPGLLSSTPAPTPTPASKDPRAGTYPQTLLDAYRPASTTQADAYTLNSTHRAAGGDAIPHVEGDKTGYGQEREPCAAAHKQNATPAYVRRLGGVDKVGVDGDISPSLEACVGGRDRQHQQGATNHRSHRRARAGANQNQRYQ